MRYSIVLRKVDLVIPSIIAAFDSAVLAFKCGQWRLQELPAWWGIPITPSRS
jgi:hypothetical protein